MEGGCVERGREKLEGKSQFYGRDMCRLFSSNLADYIRNGPHTYSEKQERICAYSLTMHFFWRR